MATWTVGFCGVSTISGQKKSFHAFMNVSRPSTAAAGRTAGQHDVPEDADRAAAVHARRLDQLVGHRGDEVLAHEEDAERGDQAGR